MIRMLSEKTLVNKTAILQRVKYIRNIPPLSPDLILRLMYIFQIVGVGAADHITFFKIGVFLPDPVQIPEIVKLCAGKGALRGNETQVGEDAG